MAEETSKQKEVATSGEDESAKVVSSVYNGKSVDLRYINIDAKAGDPSTFWVSETGHYYRTYKEAKEDNTKNAVNPTDYVATKSFWARHKKTLLVCALILAVGLGVVYLFDKRRLVLDNKPW